MSPACLPIVGVLALLGGASGAATRAQDVAECIARLRAGDARVAAGAARELAALRPGAAAEILALCSGRGTDTGPLGPDERELLLTSLRAWPSEVALDALVAALPREATLDDRLSALALAGEVAGPRSVAAVEQLCAGLADQERVHPRLAEELERAFARALERDRRTYDEFTQRLERGVPPAELCLGLVAALGRTGRGRGLALLERLLGHEASLDRAVLAALGRLRPHDDPRAGEAASRVLRRYLDAFDPELRRQAALALGRLRDDEAVPELLALLEDPDRRVQRAASLALGWISSLALGPRAEAWQHWYAREQAWFEAEAGALRADLSAPEPARALAALRILGSHPLHRRELGVEVREQLANEEPLVAVAACATLARLDDVGAVAPLVEMLEDEREAVRAAARLALTSLTGRDLGPEPATWHAWLEPALP